MLPQGEIEDIEEVCLIVQGRQRATLTLAARNNLSIAKVS